MEAIGIRELKDKASDILRRVRDEGASFDVIDEGRVVAHLVPAAKPVTTTDQAAFWEEWDRVSEEISKHWPKGVSAVQAIREDRGDL